MLEDINAPATDQISNEPFTTPPTTQPESANAFEETPEEIPSMAGGQPMTAPAPEPVPTPTPEYPKPEPAPVAPPSPEPIPAYPPISETPAAIVPKGGSSFGSLITIVLLMIAGIAIAATVFLFSQSKQLQQQLLEVTRTLEQQRTTVTPTPTPTIIEFTTPTPTPEATPTATPSITLTPTSTISASANWPLANASKALQVAINHQPNAQLILIKIEDASSPTQSITKYFFRQDLTTKKYFYVMMVNYQNPEIVDTAIYVTPDNNIPSLNDLVLGNGLGIDLDKALSIANALCTNGKCKDASVRGQYIKVGENLIWQLSFTPTGSQETKIIQINAKTEEVLYKSPGF